MGGMLVILISVRDVFAWGMCGNDLLCECKLYEENCEAPDGE